MANKQDKAQGRKLEDIYLGIFKGTIVVLMSVALLAVLALIPYALFEFNQRPVPPAPAKAPPERAISADDLKRFLQNEETKRQEQLKRAQEFGSNASRVVPAAETSSVLPYMNEANALLACTDDFKRQAELSVVAQTEAEKVTAVNNVRNLVEQLANDQRRGDGWAKTMTGFVCDLLKDPGLAQLRKDSKVGQVFYPAIRFHAAVWLQIVEERERFTAAERQRVNGEQAAEELRIGVARAQARMALSAAGAAFGLFMFMALYLIFARIERNLAGINLGLASPDPRAALVS